MFHGSIERLLFVTLAIPLVRDDLTALTVVAAGYVGLKAFGRDITTDRPRYATMLSLWGSGLSVAFGIFGGWMFWHVEGSLTVLMGRP